MLNRQERITARHAKVQAFQESAAALAANNIFGLPFSVQESEVVLIPVPWEVTVSFRPGTAKGPKAIFEASHQVDLYDPFTTDAWKYGFAMQETDQRIVKIGSQLRAAAVRLIRHHQHEEPADFPAEELTAEVNQGGRYLNSIIERKALSDLRGYNKIVGVVGGDHSAPLGLMQALATHYGSYGILHIDAHFDHRDAYEGFEFSHASIMRNASRVLPEIEKFVHVGIRDYCREEADFVGKSPDRFITVTDRDINCDEFFGGIWYQQCKHIVTSLPRNVYVSFDIDGLDPTLCPDTGTPVPGGLSFQRACFLLEQLLKHNHRIIGFDLCEVAPAPGCEDYTADWNANVGSRILYRLCCLAAQSVFGPHKD